MLKDRDEITRVAGKKKSGIGLSLCCLILGALIFAAGLLLLLLPAESAIDSDRLLLPSFVGQSKEEALEWLTEQGITVQLTQEYSDTVPEGCVISQSLPVGTELSENMEILLCLSLGRESGVGESRKDGSAESSEEEPEESTAQGYLPPEATVAPTPAPTDSPAPTEEPAPEATEEPAHTQEPKPTEAPQATEAPAPTEAPAEPDGGGE